MLFPSQCLARPRPCLLDFTVRYPIPHSYRRYISYDGRQRLSGHWAPNVRGTNADPKTDGTHALLIKTGFIQQAYSGVYQLLPLGLRVQEKIERLIDKHMRSIGASKLSLSALSSEALWRKSGRLQDDDSELLRLRSRAKDAFLLSPTHEEEITKLVSGTIKSSKDLPIRLYQISRKYRDELRPRFGLLRTREFLMKDLYTFDTTEEVALQTYSDVKAAYHLFFNDLGLQYLVADADSGSMGGNLSHEFHFVAPRGEDTLFSCGSCDYVVNDELAEAYRPRRSSEAPSELAETRNIRTWIGSSRDGRTMVIVLYSNNHAQPRYDGDSNVINESALKKLVPDLDADCEESSLSNYKYITQEIPWSDFKANKQKILIVRDVDTLPDNTTRKLLSTGNTSTMPLPKDHEIPQDIMQHLREDLENAQQPLQIETIYSTIPLSRVTDGSHCPRCRTGTLSSQRSIELGHTFHLGTRYSAPLGAVIPSSKPSSSSTTSVETVPVQMGCHGIGITRLIAASASMLSDEKGLNWPVKIAPFAAMIVSSPSVAHEDVETLYDVLTSRGAGRAASGIEIDAGIDDRSDMTLVQKLKDADLVGYPVLAVLGTRWSNGERLVEVQCRRLDLKVFVEVQQVGEVVTNALARLEGGART